jgi:YYY domain-containing protein
MFKGELGFELVKTFQSDPSLGPLRFNSQFAEEAFTVYDHPKVFVFRKTDEYDPERTRQLLSSVDFNSIIRKPPLRYESYPADLLLPVNRLKEQREGGTWSEIFDSWLNRSQVLTVITWYLCLFVIGLFVYPILRLAFPGLQDKGYPLARIAGLLLLSYLVWLAGSFEIPFTRSTITLVLVFLVIVGSLLAFIQRDKLGAELKANWRYFLSVEGIFLAFFVLDLLIRLGNPDLWHPYKGGEKPMDFAYFNAILKSTTFPPYDPWYADGYLNYYYYGFVLVGVLVKWLGIVPAVAYNLILPTLFGLIGIGAFSLAWNIFGAAKNPDAVITQQRRDLQYLTGIAGAFGMALLGNLGTVRMIWHGYQRLGSPAGIIEEGASILDQIRWGASGFVQALTGQPLPYSLGDWYWIPSRAIPPLGDVEPITEFPFFTVLYADLHAHLFALPLTLLALSFAISIVLSRCRWQSFIAGCIGFFIGALAVGALRLTNTWDFPTYLALSLAAIGYSLGTSYQPSERLLEQIPAMRWLPLPYQRALTVLGAMVLLISLSIVLFQPFSQWYALGYTQVRQWWGPRTPLTSYLIHWGVFLFTIVSWMFWQTRDWLEKTPASVLRKIQPFAGFIATLTALVLILITFLAVKLPGLENLPFGKGIQITWLAIPLAILAAILLLRPHQPDPYRIILFLVGTGLFLTLVVEIVVLAGDIGRMNTVFKFYLQVWTLFSISSAVALGWVLESLPSWAPQWRRVWQGAVVTLVIGAALFPLTAATAKIKDRMAANAPLTLDGMKYMEYAFYDWKGPMDLSEDYRAIRWMQENIQGSPVIVEANLRDLYRWGSRFSTYTGLPSVVGWEWHQQQQRVINPPAWVSSRINEVDEFYNTIRLDSAKKFLDKYDVQYFVVGPLERNLFPEMSLAKFAQANGVLWNEVYRDGETVIYEVIREGT